MRILRRVLFGVLATIGSIELLLQIGHALIHDRKSDWRPGASVRVLCVGDSHTYGAGLPEPESYPAQLQRDLDALIPGRYSVLNLGVPGMNTAEVAHRLSANIAQLHPSIVLVWCGINDAWNVTESGNGWQRWMAEHSRLYKLITVWRHDRSLDAIVVREGTRYGVGVAHVMDPGSEHTIYTAGEVEHVRIGPDTLPDDFSKVAAAATNYRAMIAAARSASVSIAFITYPMEQGVFHAANVVIRQVAADAGAPVIEGPQALQRVPPEQVHWLWAAHPNGPVYGAIAEDAATVVRQMGEHG